MTSDIASTSQLPLGLIIQPLAPLSEEEAPIPVIDCGEQGPLRCSRCRGYISPMMTFIEGGRKFKCNLCYMENEGIKYQS
jgi:protein transport protein SEC24